jgi:RNA recognition motif-containing protein
LKAVVGLRKTFSWNADWATKGQADNPNASVDRSALFIGKISPAAVTLDLLVERFSKYGEIEYKQLINKHPSGPNARCAFAFIRYRDEVSAENAVMEEV